MCYIGSYVWFLKMLCFAHINVRCNLLVFDTCHSQPSYEVIAKQFSYSILDSSKYIATEHDIWCNNTGSIPLRQLVYRVLALPPSMQPLVYDFGQLTDNTEENYTIQIVKNHVSCYHVFINIRTSLLAVY